MKNVDRIIGAYYIKYFIFYFFRKAGKALNVRGGVHKFLQCNAAMNNFMVPSLSYVSRTISAVPLNSSEIKVITETLNVKKLLLFLVSFP